MSGWRMTRPPDDDPDQAYWTPPEGPGDFAVPGEPCPTCGRRPRLSGWKLTVGGRELDNLTEAQQTYDHAVERLVAAAEEWQWCPKADPDEEEPRPGEIDALTELSDAATFVAVVCVYLDDLEDGEEDPDD